MTDLLFALDSIPAIYGLTEEPYLVFTANVFALMGLRQLYFLIGDLLKRLVYLSYGLAFLLFFIGVKLVVARAARERAALHQRRRARRVGAGDPDLGVAGRDRADARGHRGGQPGQGPRRRPQGLGLTRRRVTGPRNIPDAGRGWARGEHPRAVRPRPRARAHRPDLRATPSPPRSRWPASPTRPATAATGWPSTTTCRPSPRPTRRCWSRWSPRPPRGSGSARAA